MSSDSWTKSQEEIFSKDSVIEEALSNPIQRERIDVAVDMLGTGRKILDVGAGDGAISQILRDKGNNVVAIDLPTVIRTGLSKTWLPKVAGDASRSLPFKDQSFTAVLAGEIIEHIIDIGPFLTEIHRILTPDGLLVLTTPNAVRELNRINMLLGSVHTWHEWNKPIHHVRYFTPQTLQEAIVKHGFKPVEMGTGRSQAEGTGGVIESADFLSLEEKRVLRKLVNRYSPNPVWIHSFIILSCRKV